MRRGLGERDVADVLAEEDARGLADAVDLERPALAEHDVVQVELEDLVLREARLEDQRHELFLQLAAVASCRGVRNVFLTICCVSVLPPTRYCLSPRRLVISAPTARIGSTPGWS